eukprot:5239559-Prymnesium_polylepis.1
MTGLGRVIVFERTEKAAFELVNVDRVLTPPENGDVHVSFPGAELEGDYLCVTQIRIFFGGAAGADTFILARTRV